MNVSPTRLRLRPLPRPGPRSVERRRRRSNCTAEALELALTGAAQRGGLDAVLLVDDAGLLVAQSDTPLDLNMLAAITPIVGRGKAVPRVRRAGQARELSVDTVEVLGELLYVAALGGSSRARTREVSGAQAAARRILA